jgi:hypothetical protein
VSRGRRATRAARPPSAEAGSSAPAAPAAGAKPLSSIPRPALFLAAAAVVYGIVAALREAWLCDDAFISFRYADNLLHGLGLVYNAGERVEGYSNFLWTLWTALGLRLGAPPETWSVAWGVVFYAATLVLLGWNRFRTWRWQEGRSLALPLAALLAAAHLDWNIYATSGLETSLFTFLVTLGYVLVVDPSLGIRGVAGSGLVLALAAMTRPDGLMFAPIVGVYVLAFRRPGLRSAFAFAGLFLLAWTPYVAWKLAYYGDLLPNTYYAKSAALAWYSQGWIYVRLYFRQYWAVAIGVPLAAFALAFGPRAAESDARRGWTGEAALAAALAPAFGPRAAAPDARRGWTGEAALTAALALAYTFYVLRVGGDFMYARLLIPATPFFLILLELGIARLSAARPVVEGVVAAAALAAVAAMPHPIPRGGEVSGIVNEREVYSAQVIERTRQEGETLRGFFAGLPVRLAYVGSQAALAYYARPAVAIESQTGLTDCWIARRPLARRGRVGHEKIAPASYLIEQRQVHFTLHHFPGVTLRLDDSIPLVAIAFAGVPGRIVHWDAELLAEMERRGARIENFPQELDRYIAGMDRRPDAELREDYAKFRRFYFAWVKDAEREAPFLARLGRAAPGDGSP